MITAIRGSVAALFWSTMLLVLVLTTVSLFLQLLGVEGIRSGDSPPRRTVEWMDPLEDDEII